MNAPSAFSTASRASCRAAPRARSAAAGRWLLELEARRRALAGERHAQEVDRLRDLGQRLLERDLVPALDDPVRRGADPEHEPDPLLASDKRGGLLGEQRRAAREDADDAGAEPHPLGPGRAQRQRREAVGPVRLAAPQVGVAGGLGARTSPRRARERKVRQRQRQAPAGHAVTLTCGGLALAAVTWDKLAAGMDFSR